jgi:hypothetical protein
MKTTFLLASLVAPLIASAQPMPAPAPAPEPNIAMPEPMPPSPGLRQDMCRVGGDVLFDIEHKVTGNYDVDVPTSSTVLYRNGAWTYFERRPGLPAIFESGCLSQFELGEVTADLKFADWKTTYNRIRCFAASLTYDEYSSHGKTLFADQMCSGATLDSDSRKAVNDIKSILLRARQPRVFLEGTAGKPTY